LTLLLGVDLGTTAVKAGLYGANGDLVASATSEQQLATPAPGVVELDLPVYWEGFVDVVRQVAQRAPGGAASIVGLALSVQGETLVAADLDGHALRPAIVWLDNRATTESEQLQARFGDATVFKVTGQTEMLPTWPAPKILWVRRHEPATFKAVARWLLLEDYFIQRLTGEPWCEASLVTSTCYWDLHTQGWWPEMLEAIGIGEAQLPPRGESGTAVGTIRPGIADELGLDCRTVVSLGALDQACGAIGVGNIRSGIFSENTGGALAICATVDHPVLDPHRRIPCHAHGLAGKYMLHTFTSGGIVLRWWRDGFARTTGHGDAANVGYEELTASAASVPSGAEGVMVVPHLQGAMAPDPNPHARAAITGLRLHHGPPQVVRAILESIAYVVRRNLDALADMGLEVHEIRALGGGARSPLWKQIEASVTGVPVVVTSCAEPATLGAALLAGLGAGVFDDVGGAISSAVRTAARYEPDPDDHAVYEEGYQHYCELSETLGQFGRGHRELTHAT
jgi:sugar (pentulose or hexulose) kinase